MQKIKVGLLTAVFGLVFFVAPIGVSFAQTGETSAVRISGQLSQIVTMVGTLSVIEDGRRSVVSSLGTRLNDIAFQIGALADTPREAASDKFVVSSQLDIQLGKLTNLTASISSVSDIGSREFLVLVAIQNMVADLKARL